MPSYHPSNVGLDRRYSTVHCIAPSLALKLFRPFLFLFLVSLLPLVSPAQEYVEGDDYIDYSEYLPPASIELDSGTLLAVTNLARSISGVNATQATVDDNVSSILAILQGLNVGATGSKSLRTLPYGVNNSTLSLGQFLAAFLGGSTSSGPPGPNTHFNQGFLYQISQALSRGASVSSGHDVLSILARLEDRGNLDSSFLSNLAYRVSQTLVDRLDDFLERSDENHYRLPESVYAISSDSDHIRTTVDDILFLLQTQLDTTLGNLASYLSSIDSRISGIDSQLQSALNSSLADLETILRDVSSYAGDIYTYLGDQEEILQAISDHTDDTATGVAQIMNWLTYNFENVLLEAFGQAVLQVDWSGLPDHFNVSVDNWPSNSLDTVHSYLSNLLASAQFQASNTLGIASTLEDWYPVAMSQATNVQTLAMDVGGLLQSSTNYFSSMLLSSTDQQKIQQATNDFEQIAVDDEEEAEDLDRTWTTQDVATVTIAPPDEPYYPEHSDDLNLGNVNSSLNHGRTILLTTGAASFGIPRMEVDLFRDSGTSNFVSTLSALIRAAWLAIFGIWTAVLYYGAFRKAKGMLLASQSAGKGPNSADLELGFVTDHGGIL